MYVKYHVQWHSWEPVISINNSTLNIQLAAVYMYIHGVVVDIEGIF